MARSIVSLRPRIEAEAAFTRLMELAERGKGMEEFRRGAIEHKDLATSPRLAGLTQDADQFRARGMAIRGLLHGGGRWGGSWRGSWRSRRDFTRNDMRNRIPRGPGWGAIVAFRTSHPFRERRSFASIDEA